MFPRIIVGVDGREGGRDALALATLLQSAGGGELVAVYACAPAPLLHQDALTRVQGELARTGAAGRALAVPDRSPSHALRTIAERDEAELIVIGSSRVAGAQRILAGDDAAATLHCAPCAVAIAPRGFARAPGRLRRIGVGLDGSSASRAALAFACRLAPRAGARVSVITVAPLPIPLWPTRAWDLGWAECEGSAPPSQDWARRLAGLAAELDPDITPEVVAGTAWKELSARSADLDLLVVGTRAHGPIRRVLLGSTSTSLARHASCPLLVASRAAHASAGSPATGEQDRSGAPAEEGD